MFPVARIESVARRSVRARNGLRAESCLCRGHVVVQPYRASQQTVCQSRRGEFTFEYAIDRADGTHCAEASTIQVMIDRATNKATRIPDDLRSTLERARMTD